MTRFPLARAGLLAVLLLPGWVTAALNDTGITQCANDTQNNLTCPQAGFPSQDAEMGRDAQQTAGTLTKVGGGSAGFDFTKLDSGGNPLPASAPAWDPDYCNPDGMVNALDVIAVINAVLEIQPPLPCFDVNSDGAINALDVVFVINKVLGL